MAGRGFHPLGSIVRFQSIAFLRADPAFYRLYAKVRTLDAEAARPEPR